MNCCFSARPASLSDYSGASLDTCCYLKDPAFRCGCQRLTEGSDFWPKEEDNATSNKAQRFIRGDALNIEEMAK